MLQKARGDDNMNKKSLGEWVWKGRDSGKFVMKHGTNRKYQQNKKIIQIFSNM